MRLEINQKPKENKSSEKKDILLYNYYLIDKSGSMSVSNKYEKGISSIKEEIIKYIKEGLNPIFNITTFNSIQTNRYSGEDSKESLKIVEKLATEYPVAGTPLYQELINSIEKIINLKNDLNRIVLTVITDGQDTSYDNNLKLKASTLIEEASKKGIIVTFICTESDQKYIESLKVAKDNIATYNNTGEDLSDKIKLRSNNFLMYSKSIGTKMETSFTNSFFKSK